MSKIHIPLYSRNIPFPMEILDHKSIISLITKFYKPNLFVELGTGLGDCTETYIENCKVVCGVDLKRNINSEILKRIESKGFTFKNCKYENNPIENKNKQFLFYEMSTDDFIGLYLKDIVKTFGKIEVAFIDADHSFEAVKKDFIGIWKELIPGGIIFIHDTFPCNEFSTQPIFCNDSYKFCSWLKEYVRYLELRDYVGDYKSENDKFNFENELYLSFRDIEIFTIPVQPGLTMIRKTWSVVNIDRDSNKLFEWGLKIDSGE